MGMLLRKHALEREAKATLEREEREAAAAADREAAQAAEREAKAAQIVTDEAPKTDGSAPASDDAPTLIDDESAIDRKRRKQR